MRVLNYIELDKRIQNAIVELEIAKRASIDPITEILDQCILDVRNVRARILRMNTNSKLVEDWPIE